MNVLRVAFLHIEPLSGQIEYNRRLIEEAIDIAAERGARWIVTPELCVSGYYFRGHVGTDWIRPQPDQWMSHLLEITRREGLTIFLSYPERDVSTGQLFNSVFVLGADGKIGGSYRKIEIHPGPEEDWSTPGSELVPIDIDGVKVGMLVCADTRHPEKAAVLRQKGAQILVCPMAWGHKYGPGDRWERRTAETGIPIWVCNRTGREREVDWTRAESVVAKDGRRLLEMAVDRSAILFFNWDKKTMSPISHKFEVAYLNKLD